VGAGPRDEGRHAGDQLYRLQDQRSNATFPCPLESKLDSAVRQLGSSVAAKGRSCDVTAEPLQPGPICGRHMDVSVQFKALGAANTERFSPSGLACPRSPSFVARTGGDNATVGRHRRALQQQPTLRIAPKFVAGGIGPRFERWPGASHLDRPW
jgi:hypothetical protein